MPHSCTLGGCGACKLTLVAGSTDAADGVPDSCLTADERARGLVLACSARPTSACTLELPR